MMKDTTAKGLPYRVTSYWLGLAQEAPESCRKNELGVPVDPILAQVVPSPAEEVVLPFELADPLGEQKHKAGERIVRQYKSRVLVRATGECFLFCRHCFRRSLIPSERSFIDVEVIDRLRSLLDQHQEVREVLVSGGDPLTAPDRRLEDLFTSIRQVKRPILIRLCTRAPVVLPNRITPELIGILQSAKPLHVVIQINHPREMSEAFSKAIAMCLDAGLPVHSQTVLLRGINDSAETLIKLFSRLVLLGVHPYYLFQGDLAAGTSHFRVPLSKGLSLYETLRHELSGLELPRYAVDAPGGGGKIYLPEGVVERRGGVWLLKAPNGLLVEYPDSALNLV